MTTSKPVVMIARELPAVGIERLAEVCRIRMGGAGEPVDRLLEIAAGVDAIVVEPSLPVDDRLLDAAGDRLGVIANFGVGYDHIDLEACRRRGVAVTNTPEVLSNATAELALALTLAAARRVSELETELRAGRWTGKDSDAFLGQELTGATFGVVGMGRIGRRYAELVAPLAGRIVYFGRTRKPEAEVELGAAPADLDELLESADVVSLHVPMGDGTVGMIGADQLRMMKRSAILVNTARGPLVDSDALAKALFEGEVAAAGLDVFEGEPEVPTGLLAAPRLTLLPHVGSATVRAREAMATLVADNVLAVLRGEDPPNQVA